MNPDRLHRESLAGERACCVYDVTFLSCLTEFFIFHLTGSTFSRYSFVTRLRGQSALLEEPMARSRVSVAKPFLLFLLRSPHPLYTRVQLQYRFWWLAS